MSFILNIETATEVCSVALGGDGSLVDAIHDTEAYQHASRLTPFIQTLLDRNRVSYDEIIAVAVSEGPGSYTGLRIGTSVAKGLCYSLDVPLIGVSTLQALASGMVQLINDPNAAYCPVIDARRNEVYAAIYDFDLREIMPPSPIILDENSFDLYRKSRQVFFGGNGSAKMRSVMNNDKLMLMPEIKCSAENMVKISNAGWNANKFENLIYFEPLYLKDFRGSQKKIEKK